MTPNREIKVYGTLVNATVNNTIGDSNHNDAIVYARQVYDDTFGETVAVKNFQDQINKKISASINNLDSRITLLESTIVPEAVQSILRRLDTVDAHVNEIESQTTSQINEIRTYTESQIADIRSYVDSKVQDINTQISSQIQSIQTQLNNISQLLSDMNSRLTSVEQLWSVSNGVIRTTNKIISSGFYDSTI